MIDKKNMTEIESFLGLEEGTFQAAIESDDSKTIELPKGKLVDPETHEIFTKKDLLKRDDNLKEEFQARGVEIAVKEARKEFGLDFQGSRKGDGENIRLLLGASNAKALADAKIEPEKKVQELTDDLTKIRQINETLVQEKNELISSNQIAESKRTIESSILSHLDGTYSLPKERMLTIFNAEHDVIKEGDSFIVKKGGETIKNDQTRDPLPLKDVVSTFSEEFVKKAEGGAAGGDTTGGGKSNLDSFIARQEKEGNPVGSEAFQKNMMVEVEAGTLTI